MRFKPAKDRTADRPNDRINMIPRLATSKTWTPFPADFLTKVQQVFKDNFKAQAIDGDFFVDGRIYPEEILIRIGYRENDRLKQVNFEASVEYDVKKTSAIERIYVAVDAIATFMEEEFLFQESPQAAVAEAPDWPLHWRAYEFEGSTVYIQYSTVNTTLEAEADRILGLTDKQLVYEDTPADDALANAVVDSDLAFEIQQEIRSGNYDPDPETH
jgi:hypothetical protein